MKTSTIVFWALITGIISALATGLGAIPVGLFKNNSKTFKGMSSAMAAGMMISASVFSLAQEGISLQNEIPYSPYIVIFGLLLGAAFFHWTEKYIDQPDITDFYTKQGFSRKGFLIFSAMFIHSIPEGIAIGVAFATDNISFGLIMAIAIAVHNIPEGITISLPLRSEGVSLPKCAWISILTSVPQPIMAVPSALLAWFFKPLLPIGLGFAGGAMIYLTISELIPEAYRESNEHLTAWGVMIGLCFMLLITTLLNSIPH